MTARQKRMWIGSASGLLTIVFILTAMWIDRCGRGVSWPIRLTSEFRSQFGFQLPRKATYRVSVYCSSAAEKEYLRKLLEGGNLVKIAITGNGSPVALHFFAEPMFRPGGFSTAQWGNIVFGPNETGQDLAVFDGDPAVKYLITCSVIRPVAELDQMQPRLVVRLDPLELKGDLMLIGLLYPLAFVSGVIALVASIYYVADRGKKA